MIPTGTGGVARLVSGLVRRADATLAHGAARNAAMGVADGRSRHLDELRTLRDLRALEASCGPATHRALPGPRASFPR